MAIFNSYVKLPEGIPLPPQLFMAKKCQKLSHQSIQTRPHKKSRSPAAKELFRQLGNHAVVRDLHKQPPLGFTCCLQLPRNLYTGEE